MATTFSRYRVYKNPEYEYPYFYEAISDDDRFDYGSVATLTGATRIADKLARAGVE